MANNILSSVNRSRVIAELTRRTKGSVISDSHKKGAVLVPFLISNNEKSPEVLFTLRSRNLRQHRGQVSFPGGLSESSDPSLVHTALRETEEELGIDQNRWDIWGELPPLPDRVMGQRRVMITPVIATITNLSLDKLKLQRSEVDFVFTLPFSHLTIPSNRRYTIFKDIPFHYPVYLGGPHRIWGITGFILDYVLSVIIPPS